MAVDERALPGVHSASRFSTLFPTDTLHLAGLLAARKCRLAARYREASMRRLNRATGSINRSRNARRLPCRPCLPSSATDIAGLTRAYLGASPDLLAHHVPGSNDAERSLGPVASPSSSADLRAAFRQLKVLHLSGVGNPPLGPRLGTAVLSSPTTERGGHDDTASVAVNLLAAQAGLNVVSTRQPATPLGCWRLRRLRRIAMASGLTPKCRAIATGGRPAVRSWSSGA